MRTITSRQAIQRAPASASIFWSWMRVPSAECAVAPCSSTGKANVVPISSPRVRAASAQNASLT